MVSIRASASLFTQSDDLARFFSVFPLMFGTPHSVCRCLTWELTLTLTLALTLSLTLTLILTPTPHRVSFSYMELLGSDITDCLADACDGGSGAGDGGDGGGGGGAAEGGVGGEEAKGYQGVQIGEALDGRVITRNLSVHQGVYGGQAKVRCKICMQAD